MVQVRDVVVGDEHLVLVAGPCVMENIDLCRQIAGHLQAVCARLGIPYIFKASFDKANRTSIDSFRGDGLDEGLAVLRNIREEFALPVTTDIHLPDQALLVSETVDLLQIPAFLCRQTDLLMAAAETGKPVNVKKGQFLAPWDTIHIVNKLKAGGASGVLLCERGTSFGYNTLVVDMAGLSVMRQYAPVVFDATHSAQRPGGAGAQTGGNRESIPALARAAVAVGIDALFMEAHPDPEHALSDSATQFPLDGMENLLKTLLNIHEAARAG